MRYTEKVVELAAIDAGDDTFRITTNTRINDLVDSLPNMGLMISPVLLEKNSQYTIVCGFRRVAACRYLQWPDIRARILESETTPLECAKFAITDNAFQRTLNLIEKSRSYSILSRFYPDTKSLAQAASSLGLNDSISAIEKVKQICRFSGSIQNGVLSGTISLTIALELGHLDPETGNGFADFFSDLRLSLNKQKEILIRVKEISLRENISIPDVFKNSDFQAILHNENIDRTQKTRQIRSYLRQRRMPEITRAEKAFQKHLKKLKLGKDTSLIPPNNFEGTEYSLKLNFNNLNDLKSRRETLDKIIRNPSLKKILSRTE